MYFTQVSNGPGVNFHPEFPSKALIASSNESVSSLEDTLPTEPSFLSWEESKYSLDDQSESQSGYIDIAINASFLIPAGI